VELRQLEHFVAVAEEGHFNRAATRCHIVRSGLSASIRSLEKELGARLFVRTTHEVRLTDAGAALLSEARRTLAAAEAAREAVSGVGSLLRGALTLATGPAVGAVDVPAVLAHFHAAYPAVRMTVVRTVWAEVEDKVRSGAVDVALSFLPARPPEGVCVDPLASGAMVLACSYDHRLALRESVRIEELHDETFITVPHNWGKRTAVEEAFESAGVDRHLRMEVSDRGLYLDLVRVGLGVAVVPGPDAGGRAAEMARRSDVTGDGKDGTGNWPPVCYVPIEDAPRWTYAMVALQPELRSAAARAFISIVDRESGRAALPSAVGP
jgi:DNA-binding transcriptional LysR family regulator